MHKLTDVKLRRMKRNTPPQNDGNGLYAYTGKKGVVTFMVRYTFGKEKRKPMVIGKYPVMSLKDARKRAVEIQALISEGIHPARPILNAETNESVRLFEVNAAEFLASKKSKIGTLNGWSQNTYDARVKLMSDVNLFVGKMDVEQMQVRHIRPLRDAMFERGYHVMVNALGLVKSVLRHAYKQYEIGGQDITTIHIEVMRDDKPATQHADFILDHEFDEFGALLNGGLAWQSPILLGFMFHALCRKNEAITARVGDFDFKNRLWTIAASDMKARRKHIIPITDEMMGYIVFALGQSGRCGKDDLVFTSKYDSNIPIAANTPGRFLTINGWGERLEPHGLRGTASTWLNEAGFDHRYVDIQLAHLVRGTEAKYNHAKYLKQRTEMMNHWSSRLAESKITAWDYLQNRSFTQYREPMTVQRINKSLPTLKKVKAFQATLQSWTSAIASLG